MHSNTQSESLLIPHRRTEDNKQAEYLVTLGALQLATTNESRRAEELKKKLPARKCSLETRRSRRFLLVEALKAMCDLLSQINHVVWKPELLQDSQFQDRKLGNPALVSRFAGGAKQKNLHFTGSIYVSLRI